MNRPPRLGRWVLRWWRLGPRRAEIESDLLELFELRAAARGRSYAGRRFIVDALSLWRSGGSGRHHEERRRFGFVRGVRQDVVFTGRLFRRQPGLFGATVAGLALAIAFSTSVFSTVKAVLFADYGVSDPQSVFRVSLTSGVLRRVTGDSPMRGNWAWTDYATLREASSSLTVVAAAGTTQDLRTTSAQGQPTAVRVAAVTGDYFPVLGMRASLGRLLLQSDDRPGVRNAVLSEGFWKNQFGGDRSVIGRTIWLGSEPLTIVGTMHRAHSQPPSTGIPPALWISLATLADMQADRNSSGAWNPAVDVLGRVKTGYTRAQADTEAGAIAATLAAARADGAGILRGAARLDSLRERRGRSMVAGAIAITAAGLVVFLACANVANLLLASAASRRREIGTRLAMGASRGRIVRQLLTESVVLGLVAGTIGVIASMNLVTAFAALIQVPPQVDVSADLGVYACALLLTMISGIAAGLAPALHGRSGDVAAALKLDQAAAPLPLPRSRLRSLLVGGQAAISVSLLILAALLTRALVQATGTDLGYEPNGLLYVSASRPSSSKGGDTSKDAFWTAALDRVRQMPGVQAAALASVPPFSGKYTPDMMDGVAVDRNDVSPGYFETIGLRVLAGRTFTDAEVSAGAPVALISESLARAFWESTSRPLGDTLDKVWGAEPFATPPIGLRRRPRGTRVVGVVADATTSLDRKNAPVIYLPLSSTSNPRVVVRTAADPRGFGRYVGEAIDDLNPGGRTAVSFCVDGLNREAEAPRLLAQLATLLAAIALGLSMIGLFGVAAFVSQQRTHEVTVRRALGATDAQLLQLLISDTLRPVGIGLVCGLLISMAGGRLLQSVLYGVSGRDPLAITSAILLLLGAAFTAVVFSTRKTARANPADLLKLG